MRHIYLISLMLLIIPMANSADFCNNFEGYEWQIKRMLHYDTASTAISDTTIHQNIRQAVIKVSPMIKALKLSYSDLTEYRVGTYTLDTAITGIIDVYWSKNDSIKTLTYLPKSLWHTTVSTLDRDLSDKKDYAKRPFHYDFTDNILFLYPIPILSGDTIKITATRKLPSIVAVDSLSIIPQKYRVAILEYATYLTARSIQLPTAGTFKNDFDESVMFLRGGSVVQPTQ